MDHWKRGNFGSGLVLEDKAGRPSSEGKFIVRKSQVKTFRSKRHAREVLQLQRDAAAARSEAAKSEQDLGEQVRAPVADSVVRRDIQDTKISVVRLELSHIS